MITPKNLHQRVLLASNKTLVLLLIIASASVICGENVLTEVKDKITHQHHNTSNEVTIYTESNYWGVHWTLEVINCTDVPALFYKKASSINTHDNCVLLYSHQNCKGRHVKVAPGTDGHSHLSEINFDDTLASLQPCGDDWDDKSPHKRHLGQFENRRKRRNVNIFGQLPENMGISQNDDKSDESNSSQQQDTGNIFQTLLQRFNFINRFQMLTSNNDNSASSAPLLRLKRSSDADANHTQSVSLSIQQNTPVPLPNVIY